MVRPRDWVRSLRSLRARELPNLFKATFTASEGAEEGERRIHGDPRSGVETDSNGKVSGYGVGSENHRQNRVTTDNEPGQALVASVPAGVGPHDWRQQEAV